MLDVVSKLVIDVHHTSECWQPINLLVEYPHFIVCCCLPQIILHLRDIGLDLVKDAFDILSLLVCLLDLSLHLLFLKSHAFVVSYFNFEFFEVVVICEMLF